MASAVEPLGIAASDGPAEGAADLTPLQALGVPILDLRQDGSRYFHFHHTANDTVERLDEADLTQVAAAYAAADSAGDFGRVPPKEREKHRM